MNKNSSPPSFLRRGRALLLCLAALILVNPGAKGAQRAPSRAGWEFYRQGWMEYCRPQLTGGEITSVDRSRARAQAIEAFQQASTAAPRDAVYHEALGYLLLQDYRYREAQQELRRAVGLNHREPRLYQLTGTVQAILLIASPATMGANVRKALNEFRRAADLEKENALPLIQAASVAFDAGRRDLAVPLIQEALSRPRLLLYRLPLPEDLGANPADGTRAWWWIQTEFWGDAVARSANAARWCVRMAQDAAQQGNREDAEAKLRLAMQIGQRLIAAEPRLLIAVRIGLEICQKAAQARLALYENTGGQELAETREQITAARAALALLDQAASANPSSRYTPAEALAAEAARVEPAVYLWQDKLGAPQQ